MPDDLLDRISNKRKLARQARLIEWSTFEPLLAELRAKLGCGSDDAMKLLGYSGATVFSDWRRDGTPLLARNAAIGVLCELRLDIPRPPPAPAPQPAVTFDELADLFAVLRALDLPSDRRVALIVKTANLMGNGAAP